MKVLIIDDSDYKIDALKSVLESGKFATNIAIARSFHTGVRQLQEFAPDLVLLDMSIPTFEGPQGELGGRTRLFGGRELLAEMEFLELKARVIVVTQFDRFGDGPNTVELNALLADLTDAHPELVLGGIYYSNTDTRWRDKLWGFLGRCQEECG